MHWMVRWAGGFPVYMALMCPATSEEDVDLHTQSFDELAAALTAA